MLSSLAFIDLISKIQTTLSNEAQIFRKVG